MKSKTIAFLLILAFGFILKGQDTIKVMHYNILRYGLDCNVDIAAKTTWLQNVLTHAKPDIFTVNEIGKEEAYANRIKLQALTYASMNYAPNTNQSNSTLVNRLFYNTDKFEFVQLRRIGGNIRDVDVVTLRHKPRAAAGDTLELHCIIAHLKAGSTTSDQNERQVAANSIMTWINNQGPTFRNYLLMGDFNVGGAAEPGWQAFTFNTNTDINLVDPTGYRNGWGSSNPQVLTQAPTSSRNDCGVGGGLDDRFDFILISRAISSHTHQIGYIPGSYEALGNDGTVYNQEINCSGNGSVPSNICGNIKQISDHLPVVLQLMLGYPAGISDADWPGLELRLQHFPDYRNPQLNIINSGTQESFELCLFNVNGQLLFSDKIRRNTIEIPMQSRATGLYVLRIQNEKGQQKTVKFVW
ncbi:MAG: T9SS type A sorting domain-containing protein [Bacteroidia bacterium]